MSADAVIASGRTPDGRWLTLYEASSDPELLSALLERFVAAKPCGALEYRRVPGAVIPAGLRARPLAGEQSNTSVAFGDRMMLKVLRRIMPGANAELEMLAALERAGNVPSAAPLAWAQTAGWRGASRPRCASSRSSCPRAGTAGASPRRRRRPASAARANPSRRRAASRTTRSPSGQATAQVHRALAQQMQARPLSLPEAAELTDALVARLDDALVEVPDLAPYARGLQTAYQDLREAVRRGDPLPIQRIHGDLHLGQALRAPRTAGS